MTPTLLKQLSDDQLLDEACKNLGNALIAELASRLAKQLDREDPTECPNCGKDF
jgi:hypothetical protein